MNTYLLKLWDDIRSSYWFIPLIMVSCAIIMGVGLPFFDRALEHHEFPSWVKTTASSARTTLSTIIGAMIAVTGTVFSITVVTLSLASQQFGPRLLRTFMLDRVTQITLGLFLSTALYATLVLRVIEKSGEGFRILHISVLLSVILMIVCVFMLVIYIHHVAVMIQASSIVFHVSRDLDSAIKRLFPESIGDSKDEAEECVSEEEFQGVKCQRVYSKKEGYIQAFDEESMLSLAESEDVVIRFRFRPGDFLPEGACLAEVFGADDVEKITEPLNKSLLVGMRRTPRQDVECAIDELVEVAVRSLSPGINDPFTAITCVDRIGASLGRLACRKIPTSHRYNESTLRLIMISTTFSSILDAAFNQIRQYGADSVAVLIRMLESMQHIIERTHRIEDRQALRRHADMIYRQSKHLLELDDREDVEVQYNKLISLLETA